MPTSPSPQRPIRLLINGARGRMGAQILSLAQGDSARFAIAARRDIGDDSPLPRDLAADVVIDFSSDAGARDACSLALDRRAALLVGTTGLSPETLRGMDDAATSIAVLVAPNTSLGVAVLARLASDAARLLAGFEIEIIETHHTQKKDAPSGTALRLAKAMSLSPQAPIRSIRTGDVIGEHVIHFTGPGERITLSHSATSRELFARGALRAAAFLAGKPAGRYTIEQALGVA
jgi:4-hydroxy-tetrahydrodipicolinate reductase